ncbi:hypothetical protein JCM11251_006526 [Rhodosporidiobolus azoricus]
MRPSSNRRSAPRPLVVDASLRGEPYVRLSTFDPLVSSNATAPHSGPLGGYATVPVRTIDAMERRDSGEDWPSSSGEEEDEKSFRSRTGQRAETRLSVGSTTTARTPITPVTPLPPYSSLKASAPSSSSSLPPPSSLRRGSDWTQGISGSALEGAGKPHSRSGLLWLLVALVVGGLAGLKAGERNAAGGKGQEVLSSSYKDVSLIPETIPGRCDPYSSSRPGHLLLHPTDYSQNRWQPLDDGLPSCEPVNWMDLLRRSGQRDMGGLTEEQWTTLEFLRGKSVVAFGDSVDRDQNEHFCEFVGGKFDMVHAYDPVSPPYPPGEERPNGPGMQYQIETEATSWPDYGQSRPYICRVERLNFTTLNVFHYGFTPEGDWLRNSPHFYPPSALEARFTSIVLPLARSLFGPSGPSLFSFAPGFWDIMRQIKNDEVEAQQLAEQGRLSDEDQARLNGWSELSRERREWFQGTYERFLRRVVREWGGEKGNTRIIWRALHQPRPFINAPKNRVMTVDQIGRSVVARILTDDAVARQTRIAPDETPLKDRLYVTNWGRMILGYEPIAFRDDIHPNPMPSSWLAWNILLEQVKVQDELEKRQRARGDIGL